MWSISLRVFLSTHWENHILCQFLKNTQGFLVCDSTVILLKPMMIIVTLLEIGPSKEGPEVNPRLENIS